MGAQGAGAPNLAVGVAAPPAPNAVFSIGLNNSYEMHSRVDKCTRLFVHDIVFNLLYINEFLPVTKLDEKCASVVAVA